ncbi:MAG: hypothetical protein WD492_16400 [Alkalispirochaeta sp.]
MTANTAPGKAESMGTTGKPHVTFTGENGNIFNLVALVRRVLKAAGKMQEGQEVLPAVTSAGSYAEALEILGKYMEFD